MLRLESPLPASLPVGKATALFVAGSGSPMRSLTLQVDGRPVRAAASGMPRPDLVITCQVTLDEAMRRNTMRRKKGGPEPDELVRYRHAQFRRATPSIFQRHVLDTAQPPELTRLAVRRLVWGAVGTAASRAASP